MQSEHALKYLLGVLRLHYIALRDEDIRWAFQNEQTCEGATVWVRQYLGRETLLSFEEAQLLIGPVRSLSGGANFHLDIRD